MTKLFKIFAVLCIVSLHSTIHAAESPLFPTPTAPDELQTLRERCNYLVDHYWDRCNFVMAFKHKQQLNEAMGQWIDLMPFAAADTVHASIARLLDKFKKSGPETLELARMAEGWVWSDTSAMISDEIYLPFARAAATCKKIANADHARFAAHTKILENSMIGCPTPSLKVIDASGSKSLLSDIKGENIILFFNDPDCSDCNLARVRLSADYNANQLIDSGKLTIVSIYPGEPSDPVWIGAIDSYPSNWIVLAAPDADDLFDLRLSPSIVYINNKAEIAAKNIQIDPLMNVFRLLNQR